MLLNSSSCSNFLSYLYLQHDASTIWNGGNYKANQFSGKDWNERRKTDQGRKVGG